MVRFCARSLLGLGEERVVISCGDATLWWSMLSGVMLQGIKPVFTPADSWLFFGCSSIGRPKGGSVRFNSVRLNLVRSSSIRLGSVVLPAPGEVGEVELGSSGLGSVRFCSFRIVAIRFDSSRTDVE